MARGQSEDWNHRDENVVVQKEPVQCIWGCLYYGMLILDLIFNNLTISSGSNFKCMNAFTISGSYFLLFIVYLNCYEV